MLSKEKRALVAEIMRRGGTLLAEPCPKCGGIMLRYKGKTFCPNCDNIENIEELEGKSETKLTDLQEIDDLILRRLLNVLKQQPDDEKTSIIILNYINALKTLREMKNKNES
ncbi:MAG: autoantigen p27 domain-containing protein [Nitrososphaeria archaeon]